MSIQNDRAREWEKILTSKQMQAFAGKIELVLQTEGEGRDIVRSLVEKWAELSNVRRYFPDLEDVFTPDAIFRIEYAYRMKQQALRDRHADAYKVRCVLSTFSLLVAKDEMSLGHMKHLYNNEVRVLEAKNILPLLETTYRGDGRSNPHLYIPKGLPAKKVKTRRPPRRQLIEAMSEPWQELGDHWQRFIGEIEPDAK
jgi:hypothetical protein